MEYLPIYFTINLGPKTLEIIKSEVNAVFHTFGAFQEWLGSFRGVFCDIGEVYPVS